MKFFAHRTVGKSIDPVISAVLGEETPNSTESKVQEEDRLMKRTPMRLRVAAVIVGLVAALAPAALLA
ncbi:MAG: hypothetical protein AB7U23_12890, partial [Dehalococcoidia bacterium]